jgi:hypothetical protein
VTPVNIAPVVAATNVTASRNQSFSAASLFSATDANNDPITQYQVWDSSAGSGYFTVNGVTQPATTAITLPASQLSQLSFVAGAGTETFMVHASDGLAWSPWQSFTVTVPNNLPIVTANSVTAGSGQSVAGASLLSVSDPDNDVISQYQFWDSTATLSSGYFTVNGVTQPASTAITLTAAQLPQLNFVGGTTADNLLVRAFDGAGWSPWTSLKVTVAASGSAAAEGSAPTIAGTAANDTLPSTSAGEVMIGGAGSDTFVFAAKFGHDTVKDFQTGGETPDALQFSKGVFSDVADILAHATQSGADVVIAADAENSVTLQNVTLSVLQQHQNDLLFVV